MSLRDLAESQLACTQQAQTAENAARQTAHAAEATRLCTEWFHSVLKTEPDSIEVTSSFDNYQKYHCCRVVVDGVIFSWSSDINAFKFRTSDPNLDPVPGVLVTEPREYANGRITWHKVVTESSYAGHAYATDLPSLALHLRAVDKVIAKRSR